MREEINWHFSWKEYTVHLLVCLFVWLFFLFVPSDFKSDKNQKIMFFGDMYLYF